MTHRQIEEGLRQKNSPALFFLSFFLVPIKDKTSEVLTTSKAICIMWDLKSFTKPTSKTLLKKTNPTKMSSHC
jgi:hypothetical protein